MIISYFLLICIHVSLAATKRPHIIFILADDLGFNDLGFHGSAQIPTPNIDALAYSGIILNRYYVNPICTPSRSALMTGKYPIHTGMQHTVLYGAEPRGLPLTEKILPEYLNELGYSSHIAGKWHLGHYKLIYTPLYRGFKSHVGFWTGHHDYFDHTAAEFGTWGFDIRSGVDVPLNLHGVYTTDLVTTESLRVINDHNTTDPLFLYVAHAAVHSGNPYNPLPAPDSTVASMFHINDYSRRKYAAMLSKMDDSVGAIVHALEKRNMLKDSIIIFSTDNGGPAAGFNLNHASNWPLRGVKNTLWEGGVRGAGLIWSPLLNESKRVSDQMIQIADWLPTLYEAAGGDLGNLNKSLDGISAWKQLSSNNQSRREEILHNIDDIYGSASLTVGDWKLMKGTNYNGEWDGWYGPSGLRNASDYDIDSIKKSAAGKALAKLGLMPSNEKIESLRTKATVECTLSESLIEGIPCKPLEQPCLFNVKEDPCEQVNLAKTYPQILEKLLEKLARYNESVVPPSNKPQDPSGDPKYWDNIWSNFGDYIYDDKES
ncbi:arylsulfatase B [Hermetia illucens]|nr:arylsulfatase B [Hermetia illucens]XP_037917690.1 arylsulfatase B [Hermetia illucens]XP_037917691.1 arylsulfatase B [Hermetia illucens]